MTRSSRIMQRLDVLKPQHLVVKDVSYQHANHYNGAEESHFEIKISANVLNGKSKIIQHKIINKLLEEEFRKGLHALSIKVLINEIG